jgi:H+/Cl- antiporter ClcA
MNRTRKMADQIAAIFGAPLVTVLFTSRRDSTHTDAIIPSCARAITFRLFVRLIQRHPIVLNDVIAYQMTEDQREAFHYYSFALWSSPYGGTFNR